MNTLIPQNTEFLGSAAHYREIPAGQGDEFALLGRSNVGKSSFINHVLGNRKLARVSRTPGKTRLANTYRVDGSTLWVDLPGYGYAKASKSEKDRWSVLIADYCTKRENLRGILWLLDIRHPGLPMDREAFQWLGTVNKPVFVVLTKADKLTDAAARRQSREHFTALRRTLPHVVYSIHDDQCREHFWKTFAAWRLANTGTRP